METPAVSVIVPAYQATKYIADALDSIFRQTFTGYEIVVVNDGCPDTEALEWVLEPYQSRIRYIRQENRGVSGARNTGIRNSSAPLIALLDSDDVWEPRYLEVMTGAIEADPSIDVLYCDAKFLGTEDRAGNRFMELSPSEGEVTFSSLLTQKCNVLTAATMQREAVERAGLFDEALRSVEDFDLWLRIVKTGGRIAYVRDALVNRRTHPGSLSSDPIWMWGMGLRVLRKTERRPDLTEPERRELERAIVRFQANLEFCEGRRAFFEGDVKTAIQSLERANLVLRRRKLGAILLLLKTAPGLAAPLLRQAGRRLGRASIEAEKPGK